MYRNELIEHMLQLPIYLLILFFLLLKNLNDSKIGAKWIEKDTISLGDVCVAQSKVQFSVVF